VPRYSQVGGQVWGLLAAVCCAVPFLKDLVKSQNWSAAGAKNLGWAAPWKCGDVTGVVCDPKGNIVDL